MNINNTIGNNISNLLEKKNMSAADLARLIDVSRSTVSCWISGTKIPRMDKVEKMCAVLGCNRNAILSNVTTDSLDALEEDIITRFRQLDNRFKIIAYRRISDSLDWAKMTQDYEEKEKQNE